MKRIIITESQYKALIKESEGVNPLKMTFITFGLGNEYEKEKIKRKMSSDRERLNMLDKPSGFWACALNPEGGSDWSKWISREATDWIGDLSTHFIFKLAPSAKVLIIDSEDVIDKLPKKTFMRYETIIDWEQLEFHYDAVFVTNDIVNHYRFPSFGKPSFYSWDVASLCVFNKNIIVPIKEDIYDYNHNEGDYSDTESFWGREEERDAIKKYQINKMYKQYGNLNTEPDMSKFFKGEHPAMMAQKHGNSKDAKKARNFKGSLK